MIYGPGGRVASALPGEGEVVEAGVAEHGVVDAVAASMTAWWLVEYRCFFDRSAMVWSRVGTRVPSTIRTVSLRYRLRGWSASAGPSGG